MNIPTLIEILKIERECVRRNNGINCDRNCSECDLLMDAHVVEEAYNMAIDELTKQKRRHDIALLIAATLPALGFTAATVYLLAHGMIKSAICFFLLILLTLPRWGR